MTDNLFPGLFDHSLFQPPVKAVFHVELADGTVLEFPLLSGEPIEERMTRLQGFFEELWAVPGVREVFERHNVVVKKAGENP